MIVLLVALAAAIFLTGVLSDSALSPVKSNYQTTNTLSNMGVLKSIDIGIYRDSNLTNSVSALDWGIIEQGTQESFTLYLRNQGNSPVTLTLSTSNWNPPTASSYFTLSWNYDGQTISPGGHIQATLTLTTSPSIAGVSNFGFDITIIGSG